MEPAFWAQSRDDDDAGRPRGGFGDDPALAHSDDLPYWVEVWDETGSFPEMLVALAVTPALAYAAYYSAVREFAGRDITIRHKGQTISRWHARLN
jgi:hypothetical protein